MVLEHHAAFRRWAGDRVAIHLQAAGAGRQVPGQSAQQGGLAAAGRAEDADEFPRRDGEVQGLHRLEGVAPLAEADGQAARGDAAGLQGVFMAAHQAFLRA
ncbi:hypothetical protein D9M68_772630 [compost metagenome]